MVLKIVGSNPITHPTGEPPEPVRVSYFVEREFFVSRVSGTSFLLPLSSNGDVASGPRTNYDTRIFVFMLALHLFAKCLQVCYLDFLNPCVPNVYFLCRKHACLRSFRHISFLGITIFNFK